MKIKKFRLIQVRNFENIEIETDKNITIFTGKNGAGKTNLLESVNLASFGKSFRTNKDEELIKFNKNECTTILTFNSGKSNHEIKIKISKTNGKQIFLNENRIKNKDLVGIFKTVLFNPDEMQLIKGNPQKRRKFLDMEISQINPRYYYEWINYKRAVQQRNAELKNAQIRGIKPQTDLWDMQIAKGAAYIVRKRIEAIQKLNESIEKTEERLTKNRENLKLYYIQKESKKNETNFDVEWYIHKLLEKRQEDIKFCQTSVGPHRDDILFLLNGKDISKYGSQGQQRTAILSIKLSEMEFIKKETGEYPVLLLDDVGSELDGERKKLLFEYVKEKDIQTIMTMTEKPAYIEGKEIQIK